jgi:hypothetical protein
MQLGGGPVNGRLGGMTGLAERCSSEWRKVRLVLRSRAILAMLVVITGLMSAGVADASNHVRTVVSFDLAAGEFPEGVAVDKRGNIFVSLIAPYPGSAKSGPTARRLCSRTSRPPESALSAWPWTQTGTCTWVW